MKRVVFIFDNLMYDRFKHWQHKKRHETMAQTIREALRIVQALDGQKEQGYTEVLVRNPQTQEMKVMVIE